MRQPQSRGRTMAAKTDKNEAFTPDLDKIAITRGIRRTHMEMRDRMTRAYSIARQQEITNAKVCQMTKTSLSSAAQHLVDLDAQKFPAMMEKLTELRLAAGLIITGLNKGTIDPHSFDFSSDTYWEAKS